MAFESPFKKLAKYSYVLICRIFTAQKSVTKVKVTNRDASRVEPELEIPGKSPNCKTRVIKGRTQVPYFFVKKAVNFSIFNHFFSKTFF